MHLRCTLRELEKGASLTLGPDIAPEGAKWPKLGDIFHEFEEAWPDDDTRPSNSSLICVPPPPGFNPPRGVKTRGGEARVRGRGRGVGRGMAPPLDVKYLLFGVDERPGTRSLPAKVFVEPLMKSWPRADCVPSHPARTMTPNSQTITMVAQRTPPKNPQAEQDMAVDEPAPVTPPRNVVLKKEPASAIKKSKNPAEPSKSGSSLAEAVITAPLTVPTVATAGASQPVAFPTLQELIGVCKGLEYFTKKVYQAGEYRATTAEAKVAATEQRLQIEKDKCAQMAKEVQTMQDNLAEIDRQKIQWRDDLCEYYEGAILEHREKDTSRINELEIDLRALQATQYFQADESDTLAELETIKKQLEHAKVDLAETRN
jgi:hypothetical protein